MTEYHDLEAMASNPQTDWDVLHWIAENHPELRPAVAANPGTYQELVDALSELGDPEIDQAIAQRSAAGGVAVPPVPEAEPADSPADLWDTESLSLDELQQPPAAPETEEPVPPEPVHPVHSEAQGEDLAEAELAAYHAPYEPHPVPDPDYEPVAADESETHRRSSPVLAIAAFVGAAIAIGGAVALLILMLLRDDGTPTAEPSPEPETTATPAEDEEDEPEEEAEEEPEEEEPQIDEEAIAEARTAVTDLPESTSCDTDDDAGAVASFLAAAGLQEDFPGDDDASLLESTFDELQSECSTTHAAEVFESARSGSQAPEDGLGEGLTTVGTDWADRAVELGGAEVMDGFSAQGGNVECEFGDGLTCTVYDTNPEHCDEGATYRMTVDGVDVDCDAHLEPGDRETLSEDDSATDGFLVCAEMSDRVSCYNSIDPFGFEMSSTGNYDY